MSYARFGDDSDVYVFASNRGIECCGCLLVARHWVDDPGRPFGGYLAADTPGEEDPVLDNAGMIAHLERHRTEGHVVPDRTFERLRDPNDVADNERYWAAHGATDAS